MTTPQMLYSTVQRHEIFPQSNMLKKFALLHIVNFLEFVRCFLASSWKKAFIIINKQKPRYSTDFGVQWKSVLKQNTVIMRILYIGSIASGSQASTEFVL